MSCQVPLALGSIRIVGRPIKAENVRLAIVAAATKLIEDRKGQEAAAQAAGVKQQTMSAAKRGKVGFDLLLGLVEAWDTPMDELLARFGAYPGERVGFRAGDIPGWAEAKEAARLALEATGEVLPDGAWALADALKLPVRPRSATPRLAASCARVAAALGEISGARPVLAQSATQK